MVQKSILAIRYERDAVERDSIEERLQNVRKVMARAVLSEQRLLECRDNLTARMGVLAQELFAEQPEPTPQEPPQHSETQVLVAT